MIEVYGRENCSYCTAAKNLLESRGVFYKYFHIGDPDKGADFGREDIISKFPGRTTLPIIVVDGRILDDGYTSLKSEINEIVENTKGGFCDDIF